MLITYALQNLLYYLTVVCDMILKQAKNQSFHMDLIALGLKQYLPSNWQPSENDGYVVMYVSNRREDWTDPRLMMRRPWASSRFRESVASSSAHWSSCWVGRSGSGVSAPMAYFQRPSFWQWCQLLILCWQTMPWRTHQPWTIQSKWCSQCNQTQWWVICLNARSFEGRLDNVRVPLQWQVGSFPWSSVPIRWL